MPAEQSLHWHKKQIRQLDSTFIYNTLSGSDHNRSHRSPWSGTSVGLMIRRICSILCRSGLRPPWQQKIFSSTIAATGRQLKQSVKVFQSLILYRRLPTNNYSLITYKDCYLPGYDSTNGTYVKENTSFDKLLTVHSATSSFLFWYSVQT
jgi:hypothetical protein